MFAYSENYRRCRYSFVLLEVMVSLVILSMGLTTVLQTFAMALKALRKQEIMTTSTFLANYLIDDYQNLNPETAGDEGDFGDAYPHYRWEMEVVSEEPRDYEVESEKLREEMHYTLWMNVRIFYRNREEFKEPYLGAEIGTVLMRFERFSYFTKFEKLKQEFDWTTYD